MEPDFDDTAVRPARPVRRPRHAVAVGTPADLDDTVILSRTAVSEDAVASVVLVAEPVMPPALVEPPKAPLPEPAAIGPNVSDNIWSEPLPSKPRPFRIRLDDGTLVPLDQPVYLGRRPSVPRIHPGGVPLLVTLDSPQRELSSTHLQLTTVGGAVVASDLKSANGSVVRVPGSAPHTLVGGESTVVLPGTIIELGDGNSIEVLPPDPEQLDEHVGS